MSKPFWKSKRFWTAVVSAAGELVGVLPPQVGTVITVIGTVVWPVVDRVLEERTH